jgi:hypothetical protein
MKEFGNNLSQDQKRMNKFIDQSQAKKIMNQEAMRHFAASAVNNIEPPTSMYQRNSNI